MRRPQTAPNLRCIRVKSKNTGEPLRDHSAMVRANAGLLSNIEPDVAPLHFRLLVLAKRVAYAVMSRHDAAQGQRVPKNHPIAVVEGSEQTLRIQRPPILLCLALEPERGV
jgi:hypothetical protein